MKKKSVLLLSAPPAGDPMPARVPDAPDLVYVQAFARAHGVAYGRALREALAAGKIDIVEHGGQRCFSQAGRAAFYLWAAARPGFRCCSFCPHGALDL